MQGKSKDLLRVAMTSLLCHQAELTQIKKLSVWRVTSRTPAGLLMLNWKLLWKKITIFPPPENWLCFRQFPVQHHKQADTSEELYWNTNSQLHPVKLFISVVSPAQNFHLKTTFVQICFRTDFVFFYCLANNSIPEKFQLMAWLIWHNMTVLCAWIKCLGANMFFIIH